MPTLTDDERAAIGQRLKDGREKAAAARVAVAPQPPVRTVNKNDRFKARRSGAVTQEYETPVEDSLRGEFRGGPGTYTAPPLVRMYAPNRFGFYDPRDVPDGSVEACFSAGFLEACPDCNTTTCGDGPGEQCAAQPPRAFRRCPVLSCRKPIVDEPMMTDDDIDGESDPNEIKDDAFKNSTPETRTRAMLDNHMLWYHEQESISLAPHLIPLIQGKQAIAARSG